MATRRERLQPYIEKAVRMGLTANETLRQIRATGPAYRRTDFLADYRRLAQIPIKADRLKYVPHKYRPGPALYVPTITTMGAEYRYTVKLTVRNTVTGELTQIYNRLASDTPMTISKMLEIAVDVSKSPLEQSNVVIEGAMAVKAEHRANEPWLV